MNGWVKPRVAAKYAGVSERTLRSWLLKGLRHSRLPSNYILINYDDIDEYLKMYSTTHDDVAALVGDVMKGLKI